MEPHTTERSDPYLEDGNIVLSAVTRDGNRTHLFRLYRGLLSRQSTIFADIFSVSASPQSTAHEYYEGAPVVHMHDAAEDVGDLLKMMIQPSPIAVSHMDPRAPLQLEGALKLSTKYEIQGIRSIIANHLQAAWPHTYQGWRDRGRENDRMLEQYIREAGTASQPTPFFDDQTPEPASAIHIARLYDLPNILPAAYYSLYGLFRTENDWHAQRAMSESTFLRWGGKTVRTDLLDGADFRRLVLLQEKFAYAQPRMVGAVNSSRVSSQEDCQSPDECAAEWQNAIIVLCGPSNIVPIGNFPLSTLLTFDSDYAAEFCPTCRSAVLETIEEEAERLWNVIPSCLSL